jgi:TonB family protein
MKKLTPEQRKGLIGTVVFHALLVLLLVFLALRTPLPLPGEEGVEVNFGYDEQGFGQEQADNAQPEKTKPIEKKPVQKPVEKKVADQQPEPQKKVDENLTQDVEEAPALKEKKEEKKPEKPEKKKTEPAKEKVRESAEEDKKAEEEKKKEPEPVVNERALFKGSSKKKQGENQGITKGAGDQGKPHGYKESNRYKGTGGEGNGIAYSLGGRGSKYLEKPSVKVTETGNVVVSIWVNPEGKVIRAQVRQKGTTVLDRQLRELAVEAAMNSTFEKDPAAPPEQRGTITYQFILMK